MPDPREKIVVTGGAGFIGSHLVDRLLRDGGTEVHVVDNLSRGRLTNLQQHTGNPLLRIEQIDVRDAAAVAAVIRGAGVVYHLAAHYTTGEAADELDYSFGTNVVGTFNVLKAAARYACRRAVFTSSREVYGEPISVPVDEGHPLLAVTFHGASKTAGEAYCRAFRREVGLQTVVLRLTNVYGPRDAGRVIPVWLERATAGEHLPVFGGTQVLDLIWVDYVVDALIRATELDGPLPPINVASGTGVRLLDLAKQILDLTGGQSEIRILPARSSEIAQFVADVDRMRQLVGVEPPADPLGRLPDLLGAASGAAQGTVQGAAQGGDA